MKMLLSCDWQFVINAIPNLCWGIIVTGTLLIALKLCFKYWIQAIIKNSHEKKMKEMVFNHEKKWDEWKKSKIPAQEKLDELEKEIEDLKESIYKK